MYPVKFGKAKPTKKQLRAADAYWQLLVAGKPVPPGPPPGTWMPPKSEVA